MHYCENSRAFFITKVLNPIRVSKNHLDLQSDFKGSKPGMNFEFA